MSDTPRNLDPFAVEFAVFQIFSGKCVLLHATAGFLKASCFQNSACGGFWCFLTKGVGKNATINATKKD
jgi:hypothetical protein